MPGIVGFRHSTRQNPGKQINFGHSLANRLAGFWILSPDLFMENLANPRTAIAFNSGPPVFAQSVEGWGIDFNGTNQFHSVGASFEANLKVVVPTTQVTAIARVINPHGSLFLSSRGTGTTTGDYEGWWLKTDTGVNTIQLLYGDSGGSSSTDRRNKDASFTATANQMYTIGGSIRGATDMSIYVDGIDAGGSYSGTGGSLGNGTNGPAIGGVARNTPFQTGTILWVGVWNRSLSDQEHMQMHLDPFQMFDRRIFGGFAVPGQYTDDATVLVDIQVASTDIADTIETATVYVDIQPGGTETQEGSGTTYTDAATVLVDIQVESVEIRESIDAATVLVDIQLSAVEFREQFDAATIYIDIRNTGAECYSSAHLEDSGEATQRWSMGLDQTRWDLGTDQTRWFVFGIETGEFC